MNLRYKTLVSSLLSMFCALVCSAQGTVRGEVLDAKTGEALIGATVLVKGTQTGSATDYDGQFELKMPTVPGVLVVSYSGFLTQEYEVKNTSGRQKIQLDENAVEIAGVEIVGQRVSEKQKAAPLSVENLDAIAIKQTAAISFYNGLGNLKGVDLTTASLGFTIINMRGFNSTSPVRSLQTIDGVDNQAPGLNFSLGNFLGCSELDVQRVELVSGAAGPFYGPNAFNGVIAMHSKNPFLQPGLSASVKMGERSLFEGAIRWADVVKNKAGKGFFAYKLNFFHLQANNWEADNYDPVGGTGTGGRFLPAKNPGGFDAVNRYGDEYFSRNDLSKTVPWDAYHGLQAFHRTGYKEADLVDHNTRNNKANAVLHFRLRPEKDFESPELILSSSFGSGTTVYQGDNRFSLRNILFFQNRIELQKRDDYFIRAYATNEDAGNSYDPYFTALRLQQNVKNDNRWSGDYQLYWTNIGKFNNRMQGLGYPKLKTILIPDPPYYETSFDYAAADAWFQTYGDSLSVWHQLAEDYANKAGQNDGTQAYLAPGTPAFKAEFDRLTKTKSGAAGGTRFFDKSALYHVHGEKRFAPSWASYWTVGANGRFYRPVSEGTIFSDTITHRYDANGVAIDSSFRRIKNWEMGYYTGIEKKVLNEKLIFTGTVRADKNQNFDWLITPAASVVFTPNPVNYLRFSFSSAVRNPTLTDQYLNLDVGRATLLGNLNGFDSLITIESLVESLGSGAGVDVTKLQFFNAPPIKPEKVKTFELGYRTTLWNRLYMDAGYYFNIYNDFIGYNIGADAKVSATNIDLQSLKIYRVSANSANQVTTQGFNVGLNFYFRDYYQWSGNYSWNRLNVLNADDPIIPAFNTPEHKFNTGISARDLPLFGLKKTGFNLTYKWIEGFVFEGSPQFSGKIPTYDMVDVQWNCTFDRQHVTIKVGATNLFGIMPAFTETSRGEKGLRGMFNNDQFQTYGGPRIGRMGYVSLVYDFAKK